MRERDQIDRQVPMFERATERESTNMLERTARAFMRLDPAIWIPPTILMLTWLVLAWVLFGFLWPLDPPMPMRM